MAFSPFYNLYGQPQEEETLPYGDMFRPRPRSPFEERLFPSAPGPQIPQGTPPANPSFFDAMSEVYNRKPGPAMSAYSKYLSQPSPTPDQYKPSKMRRLGAILSGFAVGAEEGPSKAFQTASGIVSSPYEQAVRQHGMQGGQLREAAGLEDTMGQRNLQTVKAIQEAQQRERDDERQDELAVNTIMNSKMTRARTQQLIEEANLGRWITDKETGISGYVKPDGTFQPIGKFDPSNDENISSDKDKAEWTSQLIEERQKKQAGLQQTNAIEMERIRQGNRVRLRETPATTDKDKPILISPAAQVRAKTDAANELLNEEKYASLSKHITLDPAVGYVVKRPSSWTQSGKESDKTTNKLIAEFEAEVKKRASTKMNTRTNPTGSRYQEIK